MIRTFGNRSTFAARLDERSTTLMRVRACDSVILYLVYPSDGTKLADTI